MLMYMYIHEHDSERKIYVMLLASGGFASRIPLGLCPWTLLADFRSPYPRPSQLCPPPTSWQHHCSVYWLTTVSLNTALLSSQQTIRRTYTHTAQCSINMSIVTDQNW